MGGHINNYLLEKSRVVHQQAGDNNFHSFYQLLKGAPEQMLNSFQLSRDFTQYRYLSENNNKPNLAPKVIKVTFCYKISGSSNITSILLNQNSLFEFPVSYPLDLIGF